jgi:acyl-coenzyme A synthetase/AMP-(fatty) acid ligase
MVPLENPREWCILQQDIWYTAYTFKNVFNYEDNDIFWCTDIGWITGHSYILYGPLLNGATTVILKEFLLIQITVVFGKLLLNIK